FSFSLPEPIGAGIENKKEVEQNKNDVQASAKLFIEPGVNQSVEKNNKENLQTKQLPAPAIETNTLDT
ncbi:hypothetical protein CWC16_20070, partial [Pseudoalteromonas sp. S3776]|uniref:hypothetical protein n=1 Tax=Pseudoalteromonas sp. S3776 TaxID=579544 RepID=UPI00127912D2